MLREMSWLGLSLVLAACGGIAIVDPDAIEDAGAGGSTSTGSGLPPLPDGSAAGGTGGQGGTPQGGFGGTPICETEPCPILHYPFNGSADNVGTLGAQHDGVGEGESYAGGKVDGAVRLSGFGSRIELPGTSAALSYSPEYTIALWFREDAVQQNSWLLDCRSFRRGFESYHGISSPDLYTCWGAGHPDTGPGGCGHFGYAAPSSWHHLLYRYEAAGTSDGQGGPMELYLDSALVLTFDNPERLAILGNAGEPTNDLVVGEHSGFYVDELKVYDQVFSPAEQCTHVIGGSWTGATCDLP